MLSWLLYKKGMGGVRNFLYGFWDELCIELAAAVSGILLNGSGRR